MEREKIDYKNAFKSLGKCVICYENDKVCGKVDDSRKVVYNRAKNGDLDVFTPTLELGSIEECEIFRKTIK